MTTDKKSLLGSSRAFFWALFLMTLTFSSFPYFPPAMGGEALVRPLAIYPLLILLILVTIPYLFTKRLPTTLISFLPFVIAVVASSAISLLIGIDATQGVSLTSRLLRALITLLLGAAIYFTVSVYPQSPEDMKASLRWLYIGFSIALFWGSLQAVYVIHFQPRYFKVLGDIQQFFSTRRLFDNRVSGPTYEPNWFAQQIGLLLLPWLLASVLSGHTVFRWRWRWITIEWFLLLWSLAVLVFTFSRAGLAVMAALIFLGWLLFRPARRGTKKVQKPKRVVWVRHLLEAGVILAIVTGLVFAAGSNNTFFSRIWDYTSEAQRPTLFEYVRYLGFGARVMYSDTAYRIYNAYPLTGIGLGNYAFFFNEYLKINNLALYPEVLRIVTPEKGINTLITPKNLYMRLLAETGLIGLATFVAFLLAIAGCAIYMRLSLRPEEKFWGTAGILGIIAFSLSAMSFDSFAIPNMWVVFGLITAAANLSFRNARDKEQNALGAHVQP